MKKWKKFLSVWLATCLLLGALFAMSACGKSDETDESDSESQTEAICVDHIDTDGDNKCEICGVTVVEPVDYTINLKDEKGNAVVGVLISLLQEQETVVTSTTDDDGKISGEIVPGEYKVVMEGFADGWYSASNGAIIEITEEECTFDFVAIDNNPDGSEEKPFYLGDESIGKTFAAGATYNYFSRGVSSRYLVIENANAKVTYNGTEYLPENGVIRVSIAGTTDTNSTTPFTVTNTANTENMITVAFESLPGTQANPFEAKLDIPQTVTLPDEDGVVYYTWTATGNGIFMLHCESEGSNIMMYNTTSYVVTGYTDGGHSLYLSVSEGDVVSITVGRKATASQLTFRFSLHSGSAEDPIPVYENASVRLESGEIKSFVYHGSDKTLTLPSQKVTWSVNGVAVPSSESGKTVSEGDVITVTNTTAERIDLEINLS